MLLVGVASRVCVSKTLCMQAARFSVEGMAKIYWDLLQIQIDIYVTGVHDGGQICLMKLVRGSTCKSEINVNYVNQKYFLTHNAFLQRPT